MSEVKFRPSAAKRWTRCSGSVVLTAEINPPEHQSEYAEQGETRHQLIRAMLEEVPLPSRRAGVDDLEAVMRAYADSAAIRRDLEAPAIETHVEAEFALPSGGTHPIDGTPDLVGVARGEMTILDWKFGRQEIQAENNEQLLTYAAIFMRRAQTSTAPEPLAYNLVIVQPEASPTVSTWHAKPADVQAFIDEKMLPAMDAVARGEHEYNPSQVACEYCPVRAHCAAVANHLMTELAGEATEERDLGRVLRACKLARTLEDEVEERARAALQAGRDIPGLRLSRGRHGKREWADASRVAEILATDLKGELRGSPWREPELLTPPQFQKVHPEAYAQLTDYVTRAEPKARAVLTEKVAKSFTAEDAAAAFQPTTEKSNGE